MNILKYSQFCVSFMVNLIFVSADPILASRLSNDDQIDAVENTIIDLTKDEKEAHVTKGETEFILELFNKIVNESNSTYSICVKSLLKIDDVESEK